MRSIEGTSVRWRVTSSIALVILLRLAGCEARCQPKHRAESSMTRVRIRKFTATCGSLCGEKPRDMRSSCASWDNWRGLPEQKWH